MANSLLTGISGLRGHQKMLEVIGNNLANVNTTAFKSSRALFADLMYELQRGPTSASTGVVGSVNALQIGTGSRVALVDMNFTQGNLESTGQELDLAIDGGGFFVVGSADKSYFTRAGSFALDQNGYLVDPSTGNFVKRFGSLGESNGSGPAFQTAGDDRLLVPMGVTVPGRVSQNITVSGNFPAASTGATSQATRTSSPLLSGTLPADTSTLLNALDSNTAAYVDGDVINFGGFRPDGSAPVPGSFTVLATSTVGDLMTALEASFPDVTFSLDAAGHIITEDVNPGVSAFRLTLSDAITNIGSTNFGAHTFEQTQPGAVASEYSRPLDVFDERGVAHQINLVFTKQADGSWNMESQLADPSSGIVLDGLVEGIVFNTDGSFQQVNGTGIGNAEITLQFDTVGVPQTINLSFGATQTFDGLSEIGTSPSVMATSDGFPPGELNSVDVGSDGIVYGISSNGVLIPLGQLAIASFRNVEGLISIGNNYYESSVGSGSPSIGTALGGNRGAIRARQLEGSNVDLAFEFTRLIIAQRGFSANARTITVTDEILQELTNIIR